MAARGALHRGPYSTPGSLRWGEAAVGSSVAPWAAGWRRLDDGDDQHAGRAASRAAATRLKVLKTGDSPQASGPVELSFGTATGVRGFLKEKVLLGIEPSPDVIAILVVYFVQGALGG